MVDLEGFYQLASLKLVFDSPLNYRFVVETSEDNRIWIKRIDRSQSTRTDAIRNDVFDPGTIARYVRVTFANPEIVPGISEIEILGILSVR
jgi:hypothetical protein